MTGPLTLRWHAGTFNFYTLHILPDGLYCLWYLDAEKAWRFWKAQSWMFHMGLQRLCAFNHCDWVLLLVVNDRMCKQVVWFLCLGASLFLQDSITVWNRSGCKVCQKNVFSDQKFKYWHFRNTIPDSKPYALLLFPSLLNTSEWWTSVRSRFSTFEMWQ